MEASNTETPKDSRRNEAEAGGKIDERRMCSEQIENTIHVMDV